MAEPSTSPGSAKIESCVLHAANLSSGWLYPKKSAEFTAWNNLAIFVEKLFEHSEDDQSQTRPVLPVGWLQLVLLAQTNSKFSILLRMSKSTSLLREKSMT